jgi:hypothetical protein
MPGHERDMLPRIMVATGRSAVRPVVSRRDGQVFLRRSVPGIIGFGRAHRVRYPLCDGVAWIPSGQETLGESGPMF